MRKPKSTLFPPRMPPSQHARLLDPAATWVCIALLLSAMVLASRIAAAW
jgi:hypothetical protein